MWDEWNLAHVWDEHKITPKEANDAVFDLDFPPFGVGGGDGFRYLFVGATEAERRLAVFLRDIGNATGYVVAARDLSEKERELFKRSGK
jgi:hypothetical protein